METLFIALGCFCAGLLVATVFCASCNASEKREFKEAVESWQNKAKIRLEIINENAEQMVKVMDENRRLIEDLLSVRGQIDIALNREAE